MPKSSYYVDTLSGQKLNVMNAEEKEFYYEAQERYLSENKFTDASDMRGLERLIGLELMMARWQSELISNRDVERNVPLDDREQAQRHKSIKETALTISNIQKDLGLTKTQREKDKYDTVGAYIKDLLERADAFNVNRNDMFDRGLELCKELFAKVGAFKRANEYERRQIGLDNADVIVDWIYEYMHPEFDKVDEHFQQNEQSTWIRLV